MLSFGKESFLTKVAFFDLDHTLIEPKSLTKAGKRKVLPENEEDWILKDKVLDKLHEIHKKYKIVVVSNQSSSIDIPAYSKKINDILKEIGLDLLIIIAVGHSIYRKPCMGAWDFLKYKQKEGSFFVGDALGRQDDFSDTDLKFALNIGITVYEPEKFFDNNQVNFSKIIEHPLKNFIGPDQNFLEESEQEVIILVGSPASGKSYFAEKFVKKYPKYVIVSNDLNKTKTKKLFDTLLKEGKSIIVDNTNPTQASRDEFKFKKMRTIFFKFPKEVALHLNEYRTITTDKKVPEIAIHKYYKTLEEPKDAIIIDKLTVSDNLLMTFLT